MVRPSASRIATPLALSGALLALGACGAGPEPTTVPEAPPPTPPAALAGAPPQLNPPTTPVQVTTRAPAAATAPTPAPAPAPPAPAPATAAPVAAAAPVAPVAEAPPPPVAAEAPVSVAATPAAPAAAPPLAAEVAADASRPHPAASAPGRRVAVPRGRLAPPPPRPAKAAAPTAKPAAPVAPADDRPTRLAALQRALAPVMRGGAVLRTPAGLASGAPSEVTLTLPAGLAGQVAAEAARAGLPQAGASVNLTARLVGPGYTVTPEAAQAQPLIAGQPTRFVWKVAAAPDAKGPLTAAMGAQLLGAGSDRLDLGAVAAPQAPGVFQASRVVGLGLLLVLIAAAMAWLDRRRRAQPARSLPTPLRRAA